MFNSFALKKTHLYKIDATRAKYKNISTDKCHKVKRKI